MRLINFSVGDGTSRFGGISSDGGVIDLTNVGTFRDLNSLVQAGPKAWDELATLIKEAEVVIPRAEVTLLAPFSELARNIFCVGKNYVEHATEFQGSGFDDANKSGQDIPKHPIFFTKADSTIIGPDQPIPASADPLESTDYEGELTVVIGKAGYRVDRSQAMDHIFGYTIINDVTSRGLQKKHNQWFLGKNIDGFCPMGPVVVTVDEIANVSDLELVTTVNGEQRQRAKLSQLIFDIPELIVTLSSVMKLNPGDLIATGTPAGVGVGFSPPKFLKKGDQVDITIKPIGTLSNPVI
jgi:2-keto-4-pentenoate hydratase/2-oxohepta-3-ene-1,7-dioic acid hydratase in catechol pathway